MKTILSKIFTKQAMGYMLFAIGVASASIITFKFVDVRERELWDVRDELIKIDSKLDNNQLALKQYIDVQTISMVDSLSPRLASIEQKQTNIHMAFERHIKKSADKEDVQEVMEQLEILYRGILLSSASKKKDTTEYLELTQLN